MEDGVGMGRMLQVLMGGPRRHKSRMLETLGKRGYLRWFVYKMRAPKGKDWQVHWAEDNSPGKEESRENAR